MIETARNYIPNWFSTTPRIDIAAERDARVASAVHKVISEERKLADEALKDPLRRYPISVVGGGALNVAVLALEGASAFVSSSILSTFLAGFGILGGLFNLREGLLAIEEGLHAWKSNDKKLAYRLFLQGILECALGAAMLLISVAQIAGLTSITAAFAANPYVLPALFFALSIFLLIETMTRLGPVMQGTDLGSRLELSKLRAVLQTPHFEDGLNHAAKWARSHIGDCFDPDPTKRSHLIQEKLNKYKSEIGFTAAHEAFKLFEAILEKKSKEEIEKSIDSLEQAIKAWNRTLYLKVFSVVLAAGGFGAGMGAMALHSEAIDGIQNLAMAAAGSVPLYLDIAKPFEREIPIVIHRKETKPLQTTKIEHSAPAAAAAAG